MGLSRGDYAQHRGVTRQAVAKAIAAGRITTLPDGTLDAAIADAQWAANTQVTKQRIRDRTVATASPLADDEDGAALDAIADAIADGIDADADAADEGASRRILERHGRKATGSRLSLNDARLANELWRATRQELEVRKQRAELVTKRVMQKTVGELGMQYREALLNWPAKRAQALAEKFALGDVLAFQIALEEEVRAFLIAHAASIREAAA